MAKKDCRNMVYTAEVFFSPVENCCLPLPPADPCSDFEPCGEDLCIDPVVCNPRNWRVRVLEGEQQITLNGLHVVHVFSDQDVPITCLYWTIRRNTDCGGCCVPEYYDVPVPWLGSGMMLPSGEYVFDMLEQMMPGMELPTDPDETVEFTIELLFEPVGDEILRAAQYNAMALRGGCLGVYK